MQRLRSLGATLLAALAVSTFAAEPAVSDKEKQLPDDAPLVTDGKVVVDKMDFEGSLLRVPEAYRPEVRMSRDRISTLIDSVFITRMLAQRAHDEGLDKDPAVQRRMQQVSEAVLADLYRLKVDKEADKIDLSKRARELYQANPGQYKVGEQVYIQQVLIGLKGRTRDMAFEKAKQVANEVRAGKDEFLAYAFRESDEDQVRDKFKGDLGWVFPEKLVPSVREAVAKLKPGQVSEPVESEYGFHIVKLVERKPPHQAKFEEVKESIVKAERERLKKQRFDEILGKIRQSPTTVLYEKNVDALVIPVDMEAVKRAHEQAEAK